MDEPLRITAKVEILVYFHCARNLSVYTSGRFMLRSSIAGPTDVKPLTVVETRAVDEENTKTMTHPPRPELHEQWHYSKSFLLKGLLDTPVGELVVFRTDLPMQDNPAFKLTCELLQVRSDNQAILATFEAVLRPIANLQYFEVQFHGSASCQIPACCSVCIYKYGISGGSHSEAKDAYQWANQQNSKTLRILDQSLSRLDLKRKCKILPSETKSQQTQHQINPVRKGSNHSNGQARHSYDLVLPENQYPPQMLRQPPRRNRIFPDKAEVMEKVEDVKNIYELWQQLQNLIVNGGLTPQLDTLLEEYLSRLQAKACEGITKFVGAWHSDIYQGETRQRQLMAHQLRTVMHEVGKEQTDCVLSYEMFSKRKPIFFVEIAERANQKNQLFPMQDKLKFKGNIGYLTASTEIQASAHYLLILVHGLAAYKMDMEKLRIELRRYFGRRRIEIYCSSCNEGQTEGDIGQMGQRLASEVQSQLRRNYKVIPKLCFIGHSMGGLIIRAALPHLASLWDSMHSLMTLSSPHVGFHYSTSRLVDAGLWFINRVKKCQSILQLTMEDETVLEKSFLFKLCHQPGLHAFSKVTLVSSRQDSYSPYYSSRIQKSEACLKDEELGRGWSHIHATMIESILDNVHGRLTRVEVNFPPDPPQQVKIMRGHELWILIILINTNIFRLQFPSLFLLIPIPVYCTQLKCRTLDSLIGRTAHLGLITNLEMLKTLVLGLEECIF